MMKFDYHRYIFGAVLIAFIFASCASEVSKEDIVVINPQEEIPEDFFVDKIGVATFNIIGEGSGLPLSFPDQSLIIDSTLIIKFQNRSPIYFFDLSGNFKFMQKPTGQETLCFSEVKDIVIFDERNILINDRAKKTIYKYDFYKRKVVQEWRHAYSIFRMKYLRGGLIILTNDFENGLVKYIKDFDFLNPISIVDGKEPTNFINSINPFFVLDDHRMMINLGFHDTIFILDMKEVNVTDRYIIGDKQTSLRSVDASKLIENVLARNRKAYMNMYIPGGFPMKLNDFIIIPMMSSKTNVMFSLTNNQSYYGNLLNTKGLMNIIVSSHYPMMVTDVLDPKPHEYYAILTADKITELDTVVIDPKNKYLSEIKRLKESNSENPVLVKFE